MKSLKSELTDKGLSDARTGEVERMNTRTSGKTVKRLTDRELRELMVLIETHSKGIGVLSEDDRRGYND